MLRQTTLAAGFLLAAPLVVAAQEPTWQWVDATYNEDRPVTRMAAPQDLNDPNVIALSSTSGTATPQGEIRQVSVTQPIGGQATTDHSVLSPVQTQQATTQVVQTQPSSTTPSRIVYDVPAYESTSTAPQTIVYNNPQPISQSAACPETVVQQPAQPVQQYVERVEYAANPVTTTYYVEPVDPNPWYTTGNVQVVQRAQYSAPASYATPVTTVGMPVTSVPVTSVPVTVQRPTVVYNNPPVIAPVGSPVVAAPTAVPAATVYPVDTTAYRPVLPILGMNNNSYVGRGLLGQPEVYTEGQPIRNVLRYLLP